MNRKRKIKIFLAFITNDRGNVNIVHAFIERLMRGYYADKFDNLEEMYKFLKRHRPKLAQEGRDNLKRYPFIYFFKLNL